MRLLQGGLAKATVAPNSVPWYDLNTAAGMVPVAPTERNATMTTTIKATRNEAPVTTTEKIEAATQAAAVATPAPKAVKAKAPKAPKAKTAKGSKGKAKAKARKAAKNEDGEDEGEDDQPVATIVKPKYKAEYAQHDGTCGDRMASAFSKFCRNEDGELDLAKLAQVKKANGIAAVRWSQLNPGQQRMNASNVLRGMLRRGDDVTVGSEKFKATKPKAA